MFTDDTNQVRASTHVISTLENRLNMLYSYVRPHTSPFAEKRYVCLNRSQQHTCFAVFISHNETNNFNNIREIISSADKQIENDTTQQGILFLIVDDWLVGNELLDKIEKINDLVVLRQLFISLVIKNSNLLGPVSFHGAIPFDSINEHSRISPKFKI